MKIGVLGAGTAGIIAIAEMLYRRRDMAVDTLQITCIHDPSIPTIEVGESLSSPNFTTLDAVLQLRGTERLHLLDGTPRYYTKLHFDNEHDNFSVNYLSMGVHINSQTLSTTAMQILVENYPEFSEVHDSVKDVLQTEDYVTVVGSHASYVFDYVIDCRGFPTKEELTSSRYETDNIFTSVNSVILFPDFSKYDEPYSSMYFHKHGWMFGVPLAHRKAYGYLYNNKITTEEEAIQHFSELKGIDASPLRKFSWTPYYKKEIMEGRVLYLGNQLYLFEPAGALPLYYYLTVMDSFVRNAHVPAPALAASLNAYHATSMGVIKNLVAMHYCGDVHTYDSGFWAHTKTSAIKWLAKSATWRAWAKDVAELNGGMLQYYFHPACIMREYVQGFKIDVADYAPGGRYVG